MPITPAPPYPKGPGDSIRSGDWNQAVDEVIRLDNAKVNRAGDAISGSLTVAGNVRLGPGAVDQKLTIDVGTMTAPGNGLTLRSALAAAADLRIRLQFDSAAGSSHFVFDDGSDSHTLDLESANDLAFNAGGPTERMRITAAGQVGIGTTTPNTGLRVDGAGFTVGPFAASNFGGHLEVTGPSAELSFVRRTLTAWPVTPVAGDRFVWYNQNGQAALWTEVNGDLVTVDSDGNLGLKKTTNGTATFSHATFDNEGSFKPNLKVIMGGSGLIIGGGGLQYEYMVGHTTFFFIFGGGITTNFVRSFGIDELGNLKCGGSKGGYVVDHFINQAGDTLEQGDVVVISNAPIQHYVGIGAKVPVPEVDLTDKAYDTRLCGIVDIALVDSSLPFVEPKVDHKEQARFEKEYDKWLKARQKGAKGALKANAGDPSDTSVQTFLQENGSFKIASPEAARHPMASLAAPAGTADRSKVADHQIGDMVTLGAYGFCKVDADIAPIEAGDLLTTSPTKGHAQKVLDASKASGAILGKALAGLKKGRGKIPVLVSFQ